ncbi:hypothetical protein [Gloeobacter morelensis]|uniref:Uncharacterized protein n=1 Tax=Gloeobacter morelensis MG652769 TaxID=2781736 RepID=A0ABY3PMP7_9CYAN|nr:hypothetical protein [Gloeobacter morelensis]UFP94879.1 hypothetical protein ISF26_01115 [Gloeobacter morelensis MG652769]
MQHLFRLVLVLYPVEFQAEYGRAQVQMFLDNLRAEYRARGKTKALRLSLEMVMDGIWAALAEQWGVLKQDLRYA